MWRRKLSWSCPHHLRSSLLLALLLLLSISCCFWKSTTHSFTDLYSLPIITWWRKSKDQTERASCLSLLHLFTHCRIPFCFWRWDGFDVGVFVSMNRTMKESLIGGRNVPHRHGPSLNGISKDTDENMDLFSWNRRSLYVASSDESDRTFHKLYYYVDVLHFFSFYC